MTAATDPARDLRDTTEVVRLLRACADEARPA